MIRIEPAGYILVHRMPFGRACWITIVSLWNLLNHKIYNRKRSFSLVRLGGSSCWQLLYWNEVVKYRNLVRLSGLPSLGIWEICVAVQRIKNSINAWEGRCPDFIGMRTQIYLGVIYRFVLFVALPAGTASLSQSWRMHLRISDLLIIPVTLPFDATGTLAKIYALNQKIINIL